VGQYKGPSRGEKGGKKMKETDTREFEFGKADLIKLLKEKLVVAGKIHADEFTSEDLFVSENDHKNVLSLTIRLKAETGTVE
jgi:hypothetical protein